MKFFVVKNKKRSRQTFLLLFLPVIIFLFFMSLCNEIQAEKIQSATITTAEPSADGESLEEKAELAAVEKEAHEISVEETSNEDMVESKVVPEFIKFPILGDLKVKKETDEESAVVRYECKPTKDHYVLGALSLTKPIVYWNGSKEYKMVAEKASFLGIGIKNFSLEKLSDEEGDTEEAAPSRYTLSFDLGFPFKFALPPVLSVSLSKFYVDFVAGKNEIEAYTTVTLFDKIPVKLIISKTEGGISAQGLLGEVDLATLLPNIKSLGLVPPLKDAAVTISNLHDIRNVAVEVSGTTTLFDKEIILKALVALEKPEAQEKEEIKASESKKNC